MLIFCPSYVKCKLLLLAAHFGIILYKILIQQNPIYKHTYTFHGIGVFLLTLITA